MIYFVCTYSEAYRDKAIKLYASWEKHNPLLNTFKLIEFNPQDSEAYRVTDNRKGFATLAHGELLEYINVKDTDIIVWLGSDMIIQRPVTENDIYNIKSVMQGGSKVGHNLCNFGVLSLKEEARNLIPKKEIDTTIFKSHILEMPLIGLGANTITVIDYRRIRIRYMELFKEMCDTFGRHAGNQWLISYCIYELGLTPTLLPTSFHCAKWYTDSPAEYEDEVLKIRGETVLINHTK